MPKMFVLMGDFQSYSCNTATVDHVAIRDNFRQLASLIAKHHRLRVRISQLVKFVSYSPPHFYHIFVNPHAGLPSPCVVFPSEAPSTLSVGLRTCMSPIGYGRKGRGKGSIITCASLLPNNLRERVRILNVCDLSRFISLSPPALAFPLSSSLPPLFPPQSLLPLFSTPPLFSLMLPRLSSSYLLFCVLRGRSRGRGVLRELPCLLSGLKGCTARPGYGSINEKGGGV